MPYRSSSAGTGPARGQLDRLGHSDPVVEPSRRAAGAARPGRCDGSCRGAPERTALMTITDPAPANTSSSAIGSPSSSTTLTHRASSGGGARRPGRRRRHRARRCRAAITCARRRGRGSASRTRCTGRGCGSPARTGARRASSSVRMVAPRGSAGRPRSSAGSATSAARSPPSASCRHALEHDSGARSIPRGASLPPQPVAARGGHSTAGRSGSS